MPRTSDTGDSRFRKRRIEIGEENIWRLAGHTVGEEVSRGKVLEVPGDDNGGFPRNSGCENISILRIR